MTPHFFNGVNSALGAPEDWDEASHGICDVLPVFRHLNGTNESRWRVGWRELFSLAFGGSVRLTIFGGQPPVALGVVR